LVILGSLNCFFLSSKRFGQLPFRGRGQFPVFDNAETVLAIAVPGCADYTRKQTDELTEWVKRPQIGMQGLVLIRYNTDGTVKSSVDKFFNAEQLKQIATSCNGQPGDLILILAGREEKTRKATSDLRMEIGKRLGLRKENEFKLLWVLDFPLFEYAEEDNRWDRTAPPIYLS
jgi:aspartyl-tRNA synthetase